MGVGVWSWFFFHFYWRFATAFLGFLFLFVYGTKLGDREVEKRASAGPESSQGKDGSSLSLSVYDSKSKLNV